MPNTLSTIPRISTIIGLIPKTPFNIKSQKPTNNLSLYSSYSVSSYISYFNNYFTNLRFHTTVTPSIIKRIQSLTYQLPNPPCHFQDIFLYPNVSLGHNYARHRDLYRIT